MGTISRILSSLSRFMALVSSVIVAGLLGRFVAHLRQFGSNGGSKVIYTLALSGISIFFALIFLVPLKFQFWAFPFDFAMFVMWIVAFGLLTNLSPNCSGFWHTWVWRFAWGSNRCNIWRTILAFCFIAAMAWLFNAALGMYRSFRDRKDGTHAETGSQRRGLFSRGGHQPMAESGQTHGQTHAAGETV